MKQLRFLSLCLLSRKEKAGFKINLDRPKTLLVGINHGGKSAVLKSLYSTLGAKPHKIDEKWRSAKVISLLEFEIDDAKFAIIRDGSRFSLFDAAKRRIFDTKHIVSELGPEIANLLDFRLILNKRAGELFVPPPAFAFAPYYVDQDQGWSRPWASFEDLRMVSRATKPLSEYHSGIRSNAYYIAKADKERWSVEKNKVASDRRVLEAAFLKVKNEVEAMPVTLTLADFEIEMAQLVSEMEKLENVQARFKQVIGRLAEERAIWSDEVKVLDRAITELAQDIDVSLVLPSAVDCPMCGQHYANDISNQFELVADRYDLEEARKAAIAHLSHINSEISTQRVALGQTSDAFSRIAEILAARREDVSVQDIVSAAGRTEALRILGERISEHDDRLAELKRLMAEAEDRMAATDDPNRAAKIMEFYHAALRQNADDLDISVDDDTSLQGIEIGRGSAGPRGLAAYYYAFCETARHFPNSAFCPLVLDEPNQQGQDEKHLPMVVRFLFDRAPPGAQVIVAAEKAVPSLEAEVIDVSWQRDKLLRPDKYEEVLEIIEGYSSGPRTTPEIRN
ncbi:hypothetical protein [Hyphomicrobium sp.]|jgi:hypothetical protein|uniref:hypothetical protein n=1 Tax=Hyphomicrobium sp. TaxID=82 RepID=UPI003569A4C1